MTVKAWKVIGRCLLVLLCVVLVIAIVGIAQFFHRSDPKNVKRYDTDNPFITGETAISAHRSGAGDYPEETLAAFRGCVENPDFAVDYFEFDLHMTADDILVLSHDATLDRVSDAPAVFGAENVLVRDKTLSELKQLNMAAQFMNDAGEAPYTGLHGDAVAAPDGFSVQTGGQHGNPGPPQQIQRRNGLGFFKSGAQKQINHDYSSKQRCTSL